MTATLRSATLRTAKRLAAILTLGFCLILLAPAAGITQQNVGEQSATPGNQKELVIPWVQGILQRGCPVLTPEQAAAQKKEPLPPDIEALLDAWLGYSKFWRYVYYAVSVGTILFGALAAALVDGAPWYVKWKTASALLATVLAGVNSTLSPYSEHTKFDDAFVVLNTTKLSYLTNPMVTQCDVGKAVSYGESIIHKGG